MKAIGRVRENESRINQIVVKLSQQQHPTKNLFFFFFKQELVIFACRNKEIQNSWRLKGSALHCKQLRNI